MAKLEIKYRLEGKALPPRPIRLEMGGWGGLAEKKKENGSQPEPWHCPLFVDGCTHGIELLYQYETECHIVNEDGRVKILWDRGSEPGGATADFTLSANAPPLDYLFGTSLDIQAPPGYMMRTEPHPRFFRDHTQTVPAAFYGHVQSEWWPKRLFVVFKVPPPGQRHIFRKGEPYAQVIFIPRDQYALAPMNEGELATRRKMEAEIKLCKSLIAKRVWNSGGGIEFNDHYTVLARVYEKEGLAGVQAMLEEGMARYRQVVPEGLSVADYIALAKNAFNQRKFVEAKEIVHKILSIDSQSAEAYAQLAVLEWEQKLYTGAVDSLKKAIALRPDSIEYRMSLGDMYRRAGRLDFAQREFQAALVVNPKDAQVRCALALALAQQGMAEQAIEECRIAAGYDEKSPMPHFVTGLIYKGTGRSQEARAEFDAALAIDASFAPARREKMAMEENSASE